MTFIDKDKDHFKYGINQWTGEPNKPTFYNKEMALKIRELKKPSIDLKMDIVKYPDFLAIRLYEEGVASIETIDHAMKVYGGFRMGPFELMDLIGHDVNYAVTETVWSSFYFDPRYTPSFTQKRLVEAKWFGRKSGRGFYDYAESKKAEKIAKMFS